MIGFSGRDVGVAEAQTPEVSPVPAAGTPEAEGIIFERQQLMKQLDEDADTLGRIVAGELPADKLAPTAKAIADGARDSLAAFRQKVPGGRAKPEVWSNYPDYLARMEAFAQKSDEMARIAGTGNMAATISVMGEALPCKQCHDVYREKARQPTQ
ncbi:cytochrome c [Novosphingobium sp. ST904]|uniref:c-type cytochrome n=1 Tax=Novosphingobium sp. ST904 TaxID=1684385 RepID=UPI001FB49699|nr:cytochrome c [Novosphingobium sp. ST904]